MSSSSSAAGREPLAPSTSARHAASQHLPAPEPTGFAVDGREIDAYTLVSRAGARLRVMTYGGIVLSLHVPDREGRLADVALGYASPAEYLHNPAYFGAIIGRYANRIAGARFEHDGTTYHLDANEGPNHLHGGHRGFDRVVWNARPFVRDDARGVELAYVSPEGEGGYPGTLHVRVTYTLTDRNEWVIDYRATTDRATPVNLTQHTYFNLAGTGEVLDHRLDVRADRYVPVDAAGIPRGGLASVAGTPFDFNRPKALGAHLRGDHPQTTAAGGYDHTLVLDPSRQQPAARLMHSASGRVLTLSTTEPGVQLYTANHIGSLPGKHGRPYRAWEGVCLETQHFPDSPHRFDFPSTLLEPGTTYTSRTVYAFSIEDA